MSWSANIDRRESIYSVVVYMGVCIITGLSQLMYASKL